MSSPTYCVDGFQDGKRIDSWYTNNSRIAKKIAADYERIYGKSAISKLIRIDQGVAVYAPMGGTVC